MNFSVQKSFTQEVIMYPESKLMVCQKFENFISDDFSHHTHSQNLSMLINCHLSHKKERPYSTKKIVSFLLVCRKNQEIREEVNEAHQQATKNGILASEALFEDIYNWTLQELHHRVFEYRTSMLPCFDKNHSHNLKVSQLTHQNRC